MKRNNFSKMVLTLFASLALVITGTSTVNNKTQHVVEAAESTVEQKIFSDVSGDLDDNISYIAEKGTAATAPAINGGEIRVYQNGGLFTVKARSSDVIINSIKIGSSMATKIAYYLDDSTTSSDTYDIAKNGTYTISSLSNSSVKFVCKGTNKSSRLYVNYLLVTYAERYTEYTATLHYNDGVTSNSTITSSKSTGCFVEPTDPVREGYTFAGWYTEETLENEYSFTTTATSNIDLYASWIKNNPIQNAINEIDSYLSLRYTYDFENTFAVSKFELVKDASTLAAGDQIIFKVDDKNVANGDVTSGSFDAIDLTTNDISSACLLTLNGEADNWTLTNQDGKLIGATEVKKLALDDGTTTWTISIDKEYKATVASTNAAYGRILYNSNAKPTRFLNYTSNTSVSMILPQIYKKVPGARYSNVDFRLKCAVDSSISSIENVTEYGIQVSTSAGAKTYALSNENTKKYTDSIANVTYIVIQLGDVINEVEKAGVDFTVKAYAVSDGVTYYSTYSKTYSVANMIKTYYEDETTKEQVGPVYDLFVKANLIA